MFDYAAQLGALSVFLLIAGGGFIFVVIAFFLSDLFEAFGVDFHFGHAHADVGTDGLGLFDIRVLSIFVTALGCFGALGVQLGLNTTASAVLGAAGGVLLGAAVYYFGKFLHQQQASSSVSVRDLIGRKAEVTVAIPAGNVGQVTCRIGEERVEKIARSHDDAEIALGTQVRIEQFNGETAIVSVDDGSRSLYLSTN